MVVVEELVVQSLTKRDWLSSKKRDQMLEDERGKEKMDAVAANAQSIKDQIASSMARKLADEPTPEVSRLALSTILSSIVRSCPVVVVLLLS